MLPFKIILRNRPACGTMNFMTERERTKISQLICSIADGSVRALEDLSRLVSARMLSVAQSVVRNRAVAEEVVQDSFLRIVQNARRFRYGSNGYAWICKITQNVALNRLRSDRRDKTVNIDDFFDLSDGTDIAEQTAAQVAVRQAMSVLTEFERRVIYQKYFMDFSVRDSAESLGRSKSAVARAIASGEEKLKKYLSDGTNPPPNVL